MSVVDPDKLISYLAELIEQKATNRQQTTLAVNLLGDSDSAVLLALANETKLDVIPIFINISHSPTTRDRVKDIVGRLDLGDKLVKIDVTNAWEEVHKSLIHYDLQLQDRIIRDFVPNLSMTVARLIAEGKEALFLGSACECNSRWLFTMHEAMYTYPSIHPLSCLSSGEVGQLQAAFKLTDIGEHTITHKSPGSLEWTRSIADEYGKYAVIGQIERMNRLLDSTYPHGLSVKARLDESLFTVDYINPDMVSWLTKQDQFPESEVYNRLLEAKQIEIQSRTFGIPSHRILTNRFMLQALDHLSEGLM